MVDGIETAPKSLRPPISIGGSPATTIRRILKVNHAGEYGAIRIYTAQIWLSKRLYADVVPFLEETLGHEIEHCALFRAPMPSRAARPCRIMSLWGNGGYVLGFLTGLMGRQGIWVCTAAVESAVHRHLDDQLAFLKGRDEELGDLILSIQEQELGHLDHAEHNIVRQGPWWRFLRATVSITTDVLIWLSTWGDSTRMARALARDRLERARTA